MILKLNQELVFQLFQKQRLLSSLERDDEKNFLEKQPFQFVSIDLLKRIENNIDLTSTRFAPIADNWEAFLESLVTARTLKKKKKWNKLIVK